MTLKDKLPDRLKCSPLLTMESDSDIETIAESIVNLSDSDGDFFKKTEKLLLMACLGYLRDWCEPSQRTIGNLISLLDAALPKDNETHTTLDNLFYEMKSGCKRVKSEDGITTLWEPSALSRCDGLTPRDSKEYTLHATLMDKKTGEPLKVADKGVTAELKFTPNSESGTVSINLGEFDATSLDGHTLVVFEELTKQSDIDGKTTDVTVAEHKDINDEGQSVTVTSTPAGSTYGKTGVDMTNIAIAIGILLIAAGCATAYGIKSRKTTKGDADESAEDNTEA